MWTHCRSYLDLVKFHSCWLTSQHCSYEDVWLSRLSCIPSYSQYCRVAFTFNTVPGRPSQKLTTWIHHHTHYLMATLEVSQPFLAPIPFVPKHSEAKQKSAHICLFHGQSVWTGLKTSFTLYSMEMMIPTRLWSGMKMKVTVYFFLHV